MLLNSFNDVVMLFSLPYISKYSTNFFYDHLKKKNNFRVGHSYPSGPTLIRRASKQQQQLSYDYGQSSTPPYNAPPISVVNAPPAPIFDADLIANTAASLKSRQPITEIRTPYQQTTVNNQ